jgi:hypothetical protein
VLVEECRVATVFHVHRREPGVGEAVEEGVFDATPNP